MESDSNVFSQIFHCGCYISFKRYKYLGSYRTNCTPWKVFRKKCQFEDVKNIASTNNTSAFVAAVNKKDDYKWNGTRAETRSDYVAADNRSSRINPGADYKDID